MPEEFNLESPSRDLGSLIKLLVDRRTMKAYHEKQAEIIGREVDAIEEDIIHEMADQKLEKASHAGTTVTAATHVYPHVENWVEFSEYIYENRFLHLLTKRVSITGYRELLDLGRVIPGVVPFPKVKLSVTKTAR